ncbi:hypothetical protein V6N13_034876 [Hibiscus sabdariffa]
MKKKVLKPRLPLRNTMMATHGSTTSETTSRIEASHPMLRPKIRRSSGASLREPLDEERPTNTSKGEEGPMKANILSHGADLRPSKKGLDSVSNQNTQQALALPEKEVIQPHLPVRLPCYDFTPVTSPAFGIPLLAVKVTTSGMASSRSVTGGELQPAIRTEDGFLELAHPRGIATLCPVHCSTSERGHFPPVLSSFFCWIAAPALTPMDQTESDDSLYHLLQGPFLFYFLNSVRKDFTVDSAESPTSVYLYEQSIHPDLDPYPDHPVSSFGSPRIINPGSRNTHSIMEMTYI